MGKPRLLVLHGRVNFDMPTFAESEPVREVFDVVKSREIDGIPDLVYCQAYVQCASQLGAWKGPCVIPLGGTMDFKTGRVERYGKILTQNDGRTLVFMNRWLMCDFKRRGLDRGAGARMTYLPRGHWGMDHTIAGVQSSRFKPKSDYSLGDPPVVIMSLTLSESVELGRWQKCEGIPVFLEATKEVAKKHRARFVCAGMMESGFSRLEAWERNYDFKWVKSHYKIDAVDRWPHMLAIADVFVHPSMYDGWPRVPAEAMCAAVPAMSFDACGLPDIADTLIMCSPRRPETIAFMLDELLSSEELRRDVGERQHAEAVRLTEEHRGDLAKIMLGALR